MKTFLIYGVIAGLLLCTFHFVRYLIDPMWVLAENRFIFGLISLLVSLLIPILAIRKWKQETRQALNYGTALKYVFICMAIAEIISGTYESIFNASKGVNLAIENEDKIKTVFKKQSEWAYLLGFRMSGASEDQINMKREELELDNTYTTRLDEKWERFLDRMSIETLPLVWLTGIFFSIPLAMLLALFVRSKRPRHRTMDPS